MNKLQFVAVLLIFQGHLSFEPIVADILSVALTLQFALGNELAKRSLYRA